MFTLKTTIELPIAHRLNEAYSGLCVGNVGRDGTMFSNINNLGIVHGHNYFVTFEISCNKLNEDFMVMDFKKIKNIIHRNMDQYDHSLILKKGDELISFYKNEYEKKNIDIKNTRLFIWDEAPTAEYMAYKWYNNFMNVFKKEGLEVSKLVITVEETSHNSISYTED